MMRVTATEVKEILSTTLTDDQVLPFIISANILVTNYCTGTAAEKKETERWLAAHFLALREDDFQSKSIGGASASRRNIPLGEGLKSTRYGQHAMILAPELANSGRRPFTLDIAYQVEDA